jgi:hypothetical protein
MSGATYYDKKTAAVRIGRALERRGWKLYGWKEDRSEPMTDYFDPESWDGIAVKGELVACVNVSAYTAESRSGKPEVRRIPVAGDTCPRCQGSGEDPLGWTLAEARENPALYHTDHLRATYLDAKERAAIPSKTIDIPSKEEGGLRSSVSWVITAVSPLQFRDSGRMTCCKCHGPGHLMAEPRVEVLFTWPTFHANAPGKTWHVERDGRVILSGTGLNRCTDLFEGKGRALAAAEEIADRINNAMQAPSPRQEVPATGDAPSLSVNVERSGLELRFPEKPSESIREEMKRHGWRWTRFGGCWYQRNSAENRAFAEALIARLTPTAEAV